MIPNTKSYMQMRDQSQDFFDFMVLICAAVPVLSNSTAGVADMHKYKPDYFKNIYAHQIKSHSKNYQNELARVAIITFFSFFEAYIRGLLAEIVNFHGGKENFKKIADRRAKKFLATPSADVMTAKRKLQEPIKTGKIQKYKKYSSFLNDEGFRFPSELMSSLGVKFLIQKSKDNGMKAVEIPEVLKEYLSFPLLPAEEKYLNDVRDLRNSIAHGKKTKKVNLKDAVDIGSGLRTLAAKIDRHAAEHFFVIEEYA